MIAADVAKALGGHKSGNGYAARCPAHDDRTPSLSLDDSNDGDLLWHCHAGCSQDAVRDALATRGLINGTERPLRHELAINGRAPSQVWTYTDAAGNELMKIARYEMAGGKEFRPWMRDGTRWVCKSLPGRRPLYGLKLLAKRPSDRVLIVEGEKCADAGRSMIGERFVVVCWPGGAKAVAKADLEGLRGRDVTIWPDADEPGHTAAAAVLARLRGIAASVALLDVGTRTKGWDIADAIAEGWTAETLLTFIDEHLQTQYDPDDLDYVFVDDVAADLVCGDDLVERLVERSAVSVLYGDSNSGKTFLAVDLGAAIARGIDWMGRKVHGGLVVYLAAESPKSIQKRVAAYRKHHDCTVPGFVIVRSPINLYNGAADTDRVIALIRKLERRTGRKCELVIGDTLSRLSSGADENGGKDMGVVVQHLDRIKTECATHIMLIHHCGKDTARGLRGWSGIRAAIDSEIEVTDSEGSRVAEITKQRDIDGKGDRIGFRLVKVDLGVDKWGKLVTSCVVLSAAAPLKQSGKRPSAIEGAIVEFLMAHGCGIKKRDLVDHFDGRYDSSSVYREIKHMVTHNKLREAVGVVSLVRNVQAAA